MSRKELLEHLRALSDAENAAYACQQAIDALQKQVNSNAIYIQAGLEREYPITAPERPKMPRYERNRNVYFGLNEFSFSIVGAVIGVLVGILIFTELLPAALSEHLFLVKVLVCGVIGSVSPYFFKKLIYEISSKRAVEESKEVHEMEKEEYQLLLEDYEIKRKKYDAKKDRWLRKQNALKQQIKKSMQEAIDENEGFLANIQSQINQLYSMGIVYQRFQNMVAVNTLLEYLEMGVCDTLEGSNGAYAMYLQDLRMEHICGSINDLKEAMVTALKQMTDNQERLIHEVRTVDASINELNHSISARLEDIRVQTQDVQTAITEKQRTDNENAQMISKQINDVGNVIRDSAYNEYIQKRIESTNWYLRTHFRNPNFS